MIIRHHKSYKKLISLSQPEGIWKEILINFIIGLPPSLYREIAYDTILVIINKYSKIV